MSPTIGNLRAAVAALSAMMREVSERGGYGWTPPRFPPRLAESTGRKGVLSAAQVDEVEALLRKSGDHEAADVVALLFHTGLRLGELERLRWVDVQAAPGGALFLRVGHDERGTKTDEVRDVPVVAAAKAILDRRRPARKVREESAFSGNSIYYKPSFL